MFTRLRMWVAPVTAVLMLLVTSCAGAGAPSDGAATGPASGATASPFPVTVEHAFGSTTVPSRPQRVVSVGYSDHDPLLAMGVKPVAIRKWYGEKEYVWPWAEEALGGLRPTVLPDTDLQVEQIAALKPDLIIGQYAELEKAEYDKLSRIAPTVAQPAGYPAYGAPWQLMTRNLGAATGNADRADALVEKVEARFADIRKKHPEFEGVELAYAGVFGTGKPKYYVETNGSTRMRVLQDLGFVVPENLAKLGKDSYYHEISHEQIGLLEQGVVLWEPAVLELLPEVKKNPLYLKLNVSKEGRDIFMTDPDVAAAMAHSTVLSLPVVLDFLEPELTRAVGKLTK